MISDTQRSIISFIVAVLVVMIICWIMPAKKIIPRGIFLPAIDSAEKTVNTKLSVSPQDVLVFYYPDKKTAFKKIGFINVQYHSVTPSLDGEGALANTVKNLAAMAGANGVSVTLFGHTLPNETPNAQASYIFRGEALWLPEDAHTKR